MGLRMALTRQCWHHFVRLARSIQTRTPQLIRLVDEQGNISQNPLRWGDALRSFNATTHELRVVNDKTDPPIARIIIKPPPKKVLTASQRRLLKADPSRKAVEDKQFHLSWLIDSHDLQHKLQAVSNFLRIGNGNRVSILLSPQQGAKDATTVAHKKNKIEEVRKHIMSLEMNINDTPGVVTEWQPEKWKGKTEVTLRFQAKAKKNVKSTSDEADKQT